MFIETDTQGYNTIKDIEPFNDPETPNEINRRTSKSA
jgi:hypothetical protein